METPVHIQEDTVENNMLMTEEQLREQNHILVALVRDLAAILNEVLQALPDEVRELPNARRAVELTANINTMLAALPRGGVDVTPPPVDYMSGRWKKRDGDIYGIVRQPGVRLTPEGDDADNPPGNLRPPD